LNDLRHQSIVHYCTGKAATTIVENSDYVTISYSAVFSSSRVNSDWLSARYFGSSAGLSVIVLAM
tara:strand:+ start:160 stop:354 length:195 start_codon:yes stop_codon:yes gene_type:complete